MGKEAVKTSRGERRSKECDISVGKEVKSLSMGGSV
jgi:hypothetical protein